MKEIVTLEVKRREVYIMLAIYIVIALYLLYFSPLCGRTLGRRSLQLIPLKTIIHQLTMPKGIDTFIGNVFGNVIVLLPVGFFTALLGVRNSWVRVALLFMGVAFVIEFIQYLTWVGCMDIDDIWMNGLGGLLGWWLGKRILPSGKSRRHDRAQPRYR